jgi:predicted RNase H-like nuclease (RuvC/YqgF family)
MEPTTIGIILALIGVLKGKDIWDYLKSRNESKTKGNEKVIEIYETQIADLKNEIKELKNKNCDLIKRLEEKMLRSRGKKKDEGNS